MRKTTVHKAHKEQSGSRAVTIYQLKVVLPYIKPAIWRRLEALGNMTFDNLHDAIQIVMGWEDCHLWLFHVEKTEVSPESESGRVSAQPRNMGYMSGVTPWLSRF